MPRCPPPRGRSTLPEEETAFETSAFPVLLWLSPSPGWEVAAPAPEVMGNSSPRGHFLLLNKSFTSCRAWGEEPGYSLGSGVIQLVLSGAVKTSLDPIVSPQPPDHAGQVFWHDALLLSGAGERKQLPSVILQGKKNRDKALAQGYRNSLCPKGFGWSPQCPTQMARQELQIGTKQKGSNGPPPLHPSGAMPE